MAEKKQCQFKRFDESTMQTDAVVYLIGPRNTGKTTLLKHIMYHMRDKFDCGVAMCPTLDSQEGKGLESYIPHALVSSTYSTAKVREMLEYQRKYNDKNGKSKSRNLFCILDDCMFDPKFLKTIEQREIHMNGRHRKIFLINCTQHMMDIPNGLRGMIDYVIVLRNSIKSDRERLYKYFFGMFDTQSAFNSAMTKLTAGYSAMVLDKRIPTSNVEECVVWIEADTNLPPFRLCHEVYWKYTKRDYLRLMDQKNEDGGCLKEVFL